MMASWYEKILVEDKIQLKHSNTPTHNYETMQKINCNMEDLINEDKSIVLTLHR